MEELFTLPPKPRKRHMGEPFHGYGSTQKTGPGNITFAFFLNPPVWHFFGGGVGGGAGGDGLANFRNARISKVPVQVSLPFVKMLPELYSNSMYLNVIVLTQSVFLRSPTFKPLPVGSRAV